MLVKQLHFQTITLILLLLEIRMKDFYRIIDTIQGEMRGKSQLPSVATSD